MHMAQRIRSVTLAEEWTRGAQSTSCLNAYIMTKIKRKKSLITQKKYNVCKDLKCISLEPRTPEVLNPPGPLDFWKKQVKAQGPDAS